MVYMHAYSREFCIVIYDVCFARIVVITMYLIALDFAYLGITVYIAWTQKSIYKCHVPYHNRKWKGSYYYTCAYTHSTLYTVLLVWPCACILYVKFMCMQVSYDITSSEPDKTSTFYRTLPSDRAANVGRLNLIARFEWFRIATISSQDRYYAQV